MKSAYGYDASGLRINASVRESAGEATRGAVRPVRAMRAAQILIMA
jgi:hypothetical protein